MTPVEAYNQLEELLLQLDLKKRKDLEGYNFRINTLRLLGLAIQKANTSGPGGNLEWGDISGVLLDQTDLATALNNKAGLYHTHHANDSFYDNNASGLTADDVQEAITELKGIIDALPTLTVTEENSTPINEVDDITIIGATVTDEGGGKIKVTVENSPTLTVTGGDTTVNTVDNITFTGATVIDDGSGDVTIEIESAPSTFESDITVALSGGKTFGKYQTGETIPSLGKTAIEVIQMANVEALAPTITLTSNTTILFNQINISNVLNFTKVINSLNASIATLSLEWRRNNAGAWVELENDTAATSFTHALTDSEYNAQPFNYRLTVTDDAGGTATVTKNIAPTAYSAPTIIINAGSVTRYLGDINSTIAGDVDRESPLVDIQSYIVQYSINGGSTWLDVGPSSAMAAAGAGYTINHNDVALVNQTSIKYRVQVVDGYQTTTSAAVTINFYHKSFLGYNENTSLTLSQIEALSNPLLTNQKERTISGVSATASEFTYYVYAASDGDLNALTVDGSPGQLGVFSKLTDVTGVNSNGATVTYRVYKSNSLLAFTSNTLVFS